MKVAKNNVVKLSYELEVEGKIADKAGSEAPLEYIHGSGMLLPRFEEEVEGKEVGESFEFTLTPQEGYGEFEPGRIVKLPIESFAGPDGKIMQQFLVPGTMVPMLNSQGQVVHGKVISVESDSVSMDFNHPMAGKTLHFTGKVEDVRAASEKELTEGLHGEYLPKECNCEGGCSGGCEGGGCDGSGCEEDGCKGSCKGGCGK